MKSRDHQIVLELELARWSKKTYAEVSKNFPDMSINSEVIHGDHTYWIKVVGLENSDEYVMLRISCVAEGDSGFFPKGKNILFYANGSVDY